MITVKAYTITVRTTIWAAVIWSAPRPSTVCRSLLIVASIPSSFLKPGTGGYLDALVAQLALKGRTADVDTSLIPCMIGVNRELPQ